MMKVTEAVEPARTPETPLMYRVHTSDRAAFKTCRRRWIFSANTYGNMGLEPKSRYAPFWIGTGFHKALEYYYRDGRVPAEVWDEYVAEWETQNVDLMEGWDDVEQLDYETDKLLGNAMLRHYAEYAKDVDDFEVVETEVNFSVPVRRPNGEELYVLRQFTDLRTGEPRRERMPAVYEGRLDGIVRDKYGLLWILEHKTARSYDERKLLNDEQVGSYIWACRYLYGYQIAGVLYNVAMKKVPVYPGLLANGKALSKDRKLLNSTTSRLYREELDRQGFDHEPYADFLTELDEKGWDAFFHRKQVKRNPTEITEIGLRIYYEVKEMTRSNMVPYPSPSPMNCPNCLFLQPCLAMGEGGDWRAVLDENYRKRASNAVDESKDLPL
jgi:hypothetical protein